MEKESVTECINREVREELGDIDILLVDIIDAHVRNYQNTFPIISIFALAKYVSGSPVPNDDIKGFTLKWFKEEELGQLNIDCPRQPEIIQKALRMIRMYTEEPSLEFLKCKWKHLS